MCRDQIPIVAPVPGVITWLALTILPPLYAETPGEIMYFQLGIWSLLLPALIVWLVAKILGWFAKCSCESHLTSASTVSA